MNKLNFIMEKLQSILPSYATKVISFEERNGGFITILRLNIETKTDALEWLKQFSEASLFVFRVDKTYPENTQKLVFKKEYHCVHNSKPSSHGIKTPRVGHTSCNAKLTITVKQKSMKRSKDKYLQQFPTEILIRHTHNHPLESENILKLESPTKRRKIQSIEQIPQETIDDSTVTLSKNNKDQMTSKDDNIYIDSQIDRFCEDLKKRMIDKTDIFYDAIKIFMENYETLKTDDLALISAFYNFGKCVDPVMLLELQHESINSKEIYPEKVIITLQDNGIINQKIQELKKSFVGINSEHSYHAQHKLPISRKYKNPYLLNHSEALL